MLPKENIEEGSNEFGTYWNKRYIYGVSGAIIVLIFTIMAIGIVMITKEGDEEDRVPVLEAVVEAKVIDEAETTRDGNEDPFEENFESEIREEDVRPLFEEGDKTVQSQSIGLGMLDVINAIRANSNLPLLEWEDKWFNVAYKEALEYANGANILE